MSRDLVVRIDNNGSFTNYDLEAQDYLRDPIVNTFTAATDYMYIGLYKPFGDIYLETLDALVGNNITIEYYNGSWDSLVFKDLTKNISRSGFISWDKPTDWEATSVDSESLYWIRFQLLSDAELSIQGVNLVFAEDNDLAKHQRDINNFLAKGDVSFIAYHVAARDEIVQRIRNSGVSTQKKNSSQHHNFTKWDVLDISEIREAAAHLALSRINFDISEGEEDKYFQKYREHADMFGASFKLYFRTLDLDDDGIINEDKERMMVRSVTISKV